MKEFFEIIGITIGTFAFIFLFVWLAHSIPIWSKGEIDGLTAFIGVGIFVLGIISVIGFLKEK